MNKIPHIFVLFQARLTLQTKNRTWYPANGLAGVNSTVGTFHTRLLRAPPSFFRVSPLGILHQSPGKKIFGIPHLFRDCLMQGAKHSEIRQLVWCKNALNQVKLCQPTHLIGFQFFLLLRSAHLEELKQ